MAEKVATTVTDLACTTSPPPCSPSSSKSNNDFATNFASLYNSIFSPESSSSPQFLISFTPSPSTSPPSRYDASATTTEQRLRQAKLILEYDELNQHYNLCLNRLQSVINELDSLRHENDSLRRENSDLLDLIHISTSSSSTSVSVSPPLIRNRQQISDLRRSEKKRNSLPKSISVRSQGYLKLKNQDNHSYGAPSQLSSESVRVPTSQLGSDLVRGPPKGERDELELEVYRQGMQKTEICNKWQETGVCPYGDNCQFAHGIDELRPVIRHPRYKTEVCRMIVTGATCPYGHRCHFRHSLTDQERMVLMTR